MDFNLPADNDPRRLEVRKWLEAHPNATYRDLGRQGYLSPHYPPPYGLGADPEHQLIVDEEVSRAGYLAGGLANPAALYTCGHVLLKYGTEEQRERFLRPGIECEQIWCMLFSEGTGGSDLAGLRTTARREGDHYVVNGRKMWNGGADFADIGVLMTRTDPAAPKHRGLSQFLVDMKSPGISVNPIIDMTGAKNECNEVLFEDVIVPADRLIGAEGQGWEIVRSQLQTERALMGKGGVLWGAGPTTRDMIDGMIKTGRIANPRFRDTAAKLFVEGEILRLLSYRALSDRINGKPAGPEAALAKVTAAPHGQRVAALVKHSQGASGMIADKEALPLPEKPHPREDVGKHWQNTAHWNSWDHAFWFSPAVTLGVGTQEVLKNVIAEQILELPRDIDPTAGVPFNETNKPSLRAVG